MTDPILVTGGGTRLGYALARHYLNNDQPVVITYRTHRPEVDQLQELGVTCIYADFETDEGIYHLGQQLVKVCPKLKSIVHNASSWMKDPLQFSDLHSLNLMMRIHVGAPMILSDLMRPALLRSENPSVVNISDHVANRGSHRHMAYAASKGAMLNLTKSQAKKYAPEIRVNALCPALLEFRDEDDLEYRKIAIAKSSLKRVPGFQVAIESICYLQENQYTTGTVLALDGGRH